MVTSDFGCVPDPPFSFVIFLRFPPPPLPSFVIIVIGSQFSDQYQNLGNYPPTPPLTQQQSIDKKSGLMLG